MALRPWHSSALIVHVLASIDSNPLAIMQKLAKSLVGGRGGMLKTGGRIYNIAE